MVFPSIQEKYSGDPQRSSTMAPRQTSIQCSFRWPRNISSPAAVLLAPMSSAKQTAALRI